jgi:membrane-bound serine protease (ClpP class)
VIDLLATTEAAFLEQVDGKKVKLPSGEHTIRTASASVVEFEPSLRQRVVHWLSNPAVAYLLFLIGGLGIAIEFSHPGLIAPAILGAVCLVLGMIAFSALPVQAGAVILLLIGFGLIVAELFVTSGLLGAAGVVLLVLGGVLLVDRFDPGWYVEPSFRIPLSLIIPTAVTAGGCLVFLVVRSAEARKLPQRLGDVGLIGELGHALSAVDRSGGEVFVHGERWRALAASPIPTGAKVRVQRVENLVVHVEEEKQ